ncbi:MAG: PDZ domain-containing protein, partial [Patescibacteria group bacterium]
VQRGETAADLAVIPGSPADRAGITENTIILAVDGEELTNRSLASVLREKRVGETITLRLLQDGEERTVTVTLDADG